ncbi:GlcG/HbpS family heme-binding protein [Amphritea sp. HPY]|uniref:GlcG/HbpS family heme-binding protein n=1 Tax=Amphritea sp. HPY TaxID=3421652 RepID=UPI003D7E822C
MLSINRLSQSEARILINGAERKAEEIGVPMCIAITDESGNLIAFKRMDGGKIHSITIAQDKAFTAASACKGTHEYNEACVPGNKNYLFGIQTALGGRLSIVGGGLPVLVDGNVVGGIGISSGTPQQDMSCAQAGIEYFEKYNL